MIDDIISQQHAKIISLERRCDLLESVFKKLMEFDMRLDTLEFNSNLPVKPGISEKLATAESQLEHIIEFLTMKFPTKE